MERKEGFKFAVERTILNSRMKKILVWTVGLLLGGTACQSRDKMPALEERLPKAVGHMKIKHDSLALSTEA